MLKIKHRAGFRPSNWASRIALGYDCQALRFRPYISMEGYSLLVDEDLEDYDPLTFKWLMKFAEANDLEVVKQ